MLSIELDVATTDAQLRELLAEHPAGAPVALTLVQELGPTGHPLVKAEGSAADLWQFLRDVYCAGDAVTAMELFQTLQS